MTHLPSMREATMDPLYSIGEAADILGVSVPTLRLYEREGLIIPIRKASRHRLYSRDDLKRIRCLRETINQKKVGIAGLRRLLSLIPCWKIHHCAVSDRETCPAFTDDQTPCWTVQSKSSACRTADCRVCPVYVHVADCSMLKRTIIHFTLDQPTSQ